MVSVYNCGTRIIRFPADGIVVVKYNPPCPPIQIYAREGKKLVRLIYDKGPDKAPTKIELPQRHLEEAVIMALEGAETSFIEKKHQNILVNDSSLPYVPKNLWGTPNGEYSVWD